MSIAVDPDWWKTLFDEVYLQTDARSIGDEKITRQEIDIFCNLIPLEVDHHILDLCGGQGRHSIELSRRGFNHCTVFDFSAPLLKIGARHARRNNHRIEFVRGDARDTRLAAAVFDRILILGNSLGYIPETDSDLMIVRESYRLLKSEGWLLIDVTDGKMVSDKFTPNAWHEIDPDIVVCRQRQLQGTTICARELVLSKKTGLIRDKTYCVRLYDPDDLIDLVSRAGFDDIRIHTDFSPHSVQGDLGFMNHRMLVTARKF